MQQCGDTVGSCSPARACFLTMGAHSLWPGDGWGIKELGCTVGRQYCSPGLDVHKKRERFEGGSVIAFGEMSGAMSKRGFSCAFILPKYQNQNVIYHMWHLNVTSV